MSSSPSDQKKSSPRITTRDALSMEHQRPGPEHIQLGKLVGTWTVSVAHWLPDREEPLLSSGKAVYTTILEGRYLKEDFVGEVDGKPFSGFGLLGYDRASRRYVNIWCDSVGTGIVSTTGISSRNGLEITFTGITQCAHSQVPTKIRHVHRRESDDQFTFTMYHEVDGREQKTMDLVYMRSHTGAVPEPSLLVMPQLPIDH